MSNSNVPINTEEGIPVGLIAVIALTIFSVVIVVPCLMVVAFLVALRREKQALEAQPEEEAASQDRKKEMTSDSEFISNGMIV